MIFVDFHLTSTNNIWCRATPTVFKYEILERSPPDWSIIGSVSPIREVICICWGCIVTKSNMGSFSSNKAIFLWVYGQFYGIDLTWKYLYELCNIEEIPPTSQTSDIMILHQHMGVKLYIILSLIYVPNLYINTVKIQWFLCTAEIKQIG